MSLLPTLVQRFAGRIVPILSLLDCQAAQARLAKSKLPQPSVDLIDIAVTPAILLCCICTTSRETRIPVLAVLVSYCWSHVPIQKAGHQGYSANNILGVSHTETLCLGWFIKLDHPSFFHGSFDGQCKLLEGAGENQVKPAIVWANFVPCILWHSSSLLAEVAAEDEDSAVQQNSKSTT
jgi:hypothetical protein